MGKISFLSLTEILLSSGLKFVTEHAERWDGGSIIKLVHSKGYQDASPYIQKGNPEDQNNMSVDRLVTNGDVLAYYDTNRQTIIGAPKKIYDIIEGIKKENKTIIISK